jgi:hypothetical protein
MIQPVETKLSGFAVGKRERQTMRVTFEAPSEVELDATALASLILEAEEVVVQHFRVEEVTMSSGAASAILRVTAWSENRGDRRVGVCLMLAGRDAGGKPVWTCYLPGVHEGRGQRKLLESLLVPPDAVGRTVRIWVRFACSHELADAAPIRNAT